VTVKEEVLDHLDSLIQEGYRLNDSFRMNELAQMESKLPEMELRSFATATSPQ